MQAVVQAAHAQARQEEEAQRKYSARPNQDARAEAPGFSPWGGPGTAGGPNPPKGVPWTRLFTASTGRLSDEDAEFDTDPFLPRLTASGAIASSLVDETGGQSNHTTPPNGTAQAGPERPEPERTAPVEPDQAAQPGGPVAAAVRAPAARLERPRPDAPKTQSRRRYRMAALAIGVATALAVGPLALMLSRPAPAKLSPAEITRGQAASWVAQQVSGSAVVSCDLTMCQTLRTDGVPVGDLLVVGPQARDLLSSQVIVSTATIRNLFGSRLGSAYAPTVLASFGSGKTRIDVRVIASDGAAAYLAALRADLQERKSGGEALAANSRIKLTAAARRQMDAGQVDARLLLTITSLAIIHPLDILAFGDLAPGASPGVPLRSVTLAGSGTAAIMRSMFDTLRSQRGTFRAAHIETARRDGQSVLVIVFAAPVPLGLISGSTP